MIDAPRLARMGSVENDQAERVLEIVEATGLVVDGEVSADLALYIKAKVDGLVASDDD